MHLSFDPRSPFTRIIRAANKRIPRIYWLLTLAPRLIIGAFWVQWFSRQGLGQSLRHLDVQSVRTSDTLFVLATGASINSYDHSRWATIAQHNSIGMTWFMLHDFVPDLFVMENMENIHRRLLEMRAEAYQDVPIILKTQVSNLSISRVKDRMSNIAQNSESIRSRFYYSLDVAAAGRTHQDMYWSYRVLKKMGLFKPRPRFQLLTKRRGSVTYIINMAVRMGYRRIVLCGVDLNHDNYFYDPKREELEAMGLPVPPPLAGGSVHPTNDPVKHPVTVKDVILAMNEITLQPQGIELLVGHNSSELYPDLPEYEWENGRPLSRNRDD